MLKSYDFILSITRDPCHSPRWVLDSPFSVNWDLPKFSNFQFWQWYLNFVLIFYKVQISTNFKKMILKFFVLFVSLVLNGKHVLVREITPIKKYFKKWMNNFRITLGMYLWSIVIHFIYRWRYHSCKSCCSWYYCWYSNTIPNTKCRWM